MLKSASNVNNDHELSVNNKSVINYIAIIKTKTKSYFYFLLLLIQAKI